MVCCLTRGAALGQLKCRTIWKRILAKCPLNICFTRNIHDGNVQISHRYNITTCKTVKLFSNRKIPTFTRKSVCQIHESYGNETDSDSEGIDEFLDPSVSLEEKESVHDILSPNTEDLIILKLKSSASIQEVFETIFENETDIQGIYVTHAILALWDLQIASLNLSEKKDSMNLLFESFVSYLLSHPDILRFLRILKESCEDMSPDIVACTVLYLSKLGIGEIVDSQSVCVKLTHEVIVDLFNKCENMLDEFPLTALSRFMVAVRVWNSSSPSEYNWFPSHGKLESVITKHFQDCTNAEDFRLLTICLAHLKPSSNNIMLYEFKKLVEDMLSNGTLDSKSFRPIVKAVAYLNLPHWSHLNIDLIRSLLLLIKGNIRNLKPADLILVNRVLQSQMEPANLLMEVQESASNFLKDKGHKVPIIDLLACLVHSVQPSQKRRFEEVTLDFINTSLNPRLLPVTFKVIRHLKTANVDLCNGFWSRALAYIQAKSRLQEPHRLLRFCHWYMHFNNNLGGTYRHLNFETCLTEIILRDIIQWNDPSWIARASAFVIAYGRKSHRPEVVLDLSERLFNLVPKLSLDDCLIVSHGLRIAMSIGRTSRQKTRIFLWSWTQLSRKLDQCSEEKLKSDKLTLRDLNVLARGFIERRAFQENRPVFSESLVSRYDSLVRGLDEKQISSSQSCSKAISSRAVRDVAANMMGGDWLLPGAADCLAEYVVQQSACLSGETIERVLQTFFLLNHYPVAAEKFFESASEVLDRDKERIPGLSLLQSSLGLCYFHFLPTSLIHYIFAVDFLERLDDEIRHCYAKATYPVRVRYNLMELNRAVCLDYPEADVPWFHKKYCEEIISLDSLVRTTLQTDVLATLMELLDGNFAYIQEKAYSPYFHKIDFLLVLDKFGNPISPKHITQDDVVEKKLTRVAVVLRGRESFCNRLNSPKPHTRCLPLLHQRHLELLGYKVVIVPEYHWDSMQMASKEARYNELKESIFGNAK